MADLLTAVQTQRWRVDIGQHEFPIWGMQVQIDDGLRNIDPNPVRDPIEKLGSGRNGGAK